MGSLNLKVENGKLIREIPTARLDYIISECNKRISQIDEEIITLNTEKAEVQVEIDKANSLKSQLGVVPQP